MSLRKRDATIELLRIIGAFIVISTHIKLGLTIGGDVGKIRVMIACFTGDGVAIFWMILGFFYFRGTYKKHLSAMVKRILIPLAVSSVIWFYIYDFLAGYKPTLLSSILHPLSDYTDAFKTLLEWKNPVHGAGHFWYLYVYVLVILLFPALKGLRDYMLTLRHGDLIMMAVITGSLIFNEFSINKFYEFSHHGFRGALGAAVWILVGDIVYRHIDFIRGKLKYGFLGLVGFFAANGIRSYIQYRILQSDNPTNEPLFWYTAYALFSVLFLTMAAFGFERIWSGHEKVCDVIRHLGSRTFYIYIVHILIRDTFKYHGIQQFFIDRFGVWGIGALGYEITYALVIFAVSLVFSELIEGIIALFKRLFKRSKAQKTTA